MTRKVADHVASVRRPPADGPAGGDRGGGRLAQALSGSIARPRAEVGPMRCSRVLEALQEISVAPPDFEGCGVLLRSAVAAMEAEQGVFILSNPLTAQLEFVIHNQPPEQCRSYAEHFSDLDPSHLARWLVDERAPSASQSGSAVVDLLELVEYDWLAGTEFYADFMRRAEIEHSLVAVGQASPRTRAVMCLHRSKHQRSFTGEDVAVLDMLAPFLSNHLQRMMGTTVLATFPEVADKGVILCDSHGHVLFCNDAARDICPPGPEPTALVGAASWPSGDSTAAEFIGYAVDDPDMLAERWGTGVASRHVTLGEDREGVLIMLESPEGGHPDDPDILRRRFSLTDRELEVLHAMMAGATNRQIAARLFIEECTVKKHMQSIATKVGARTRTGVAHAVHEAMRTPHAPRRQTAPLRSP